MSDVTKDQVLRLERVGLAIVEEAAAEFSELNKSISYNKQSINELYSDFRKIVELMNEEEILNEGQDK